jgi:hypothetical protein
MIVVMFQKRTYEDRVVGTIREGVSDFEQRTRDENIMSPKRELPHKALSESS